MFIADRLFSVVGPEQAAAIKAPRFSAAFAAGGGALSVAVPVEIRRLPTDLLLIT